MLAFDLLLNSYWAIF